MKIASLVFVNQRRKTSREDEPERVATVGYLGAQASLPARLRKKLVGQQSNTAVPVTVMPGGELLDRRRVILTDRGLPRHPHHHEDSLECGGPAPLWSRLAQSHLVIHQDLLGGRSLPKYPGSASTSKKLEVGKAGLPPPFVAQCEH
jgi:hypothetical protein